MDSLIHQSTFESQGVNMYNLKYLGLSGKQVL